MQGVGVFGAGTAVAGLLFVGAVDHLDALRKRPEAVERGRSSSVAEPRRRWWRRP